MGVALVLHLPLPSSSLQTWMYPTWTNMPALPFPKSRSLNANPSSMGMDLHPVVCQIRSRGAPSSLEPLPIASRSSLTHTATSVEEHPYGYPVVPCVCPDILMTKRALKTMLFRAIRAYIRHCLSMGLAQGQGGEFLRIRFTFYI